MKVTRRLVSFILIIATVFVYYVAIPAKTWADETQFSQAIEAYTDSNNFSKETKLEYSPLVGENTEGRGETSKTFHRADGASEVVMYSYPVHYDDGGQWKSIDNTLVPITNENNEIIGYRNTASKIQVQFAAFLNSDELVKYVLDSDKSLSWKFTGMARLQGTVVTDSAASANTQLTDEEADMLLRFPQTLSSQILYEDAQSGFSVRYALNSYELSEFITLNQKPTKKVAYTIELNCTGIVPVTQADGSIVFVDAQGNEALRMGKPIMDDATGEQSDSLLITLTDKEANGNKLYNPDTAGTFGGTYTYTIEPDMNFLQSEDCVYPVVIDPDIKPLFSGSVEDTHISNSSRDQNFNARDRLVIGGDAHYRALIKMSGLPALEAGDVIVESTLNLSRYNTSIAYGKQIDLRQVLKSWDYNTVTWNNFQPDSQMSVDRTRVESIAMTVPKNQFNTFDITRLVKYWYENPDENYGMMLESWNEPANWYTEYRSSNYNDTYSGHPYFSIIYINSTGLEGRFTYHSQSVGRAGTGSVNDYSGNLAFSRSDAGITNGTMPITVSHVFNTNDKNTDIGYGYGWRLNYAQSMKKVEITNRTTTKTYYQLIDGDGTRHYYEPEGSSTVNYVNELDKDSKLTVNSADQTITLTDKGDNKMVFDCDSTMDNGRLACIEDANGNQTVISYTTNTITNLRISSIAEKHAGNSGIGQSITLTYSGNRLYKVTPPDGLYAYYYYTGGNLTGVRNSDGKYCYYSYNANRCLTQATNIDNYNVNYEYSSAAPYRVTKATEKANTTVGNHITFDYGWSTTTVTDNQGRAVIYQFDNNGQAVSVRDNEGGAVFAAYNSAEQTVTQMSAVSNLQNTVFNLLMNHGFETTSGSTWTRSNTTYVTYSSTYQHTGKYSLKMVSASNRTVYATQNVSVTAGETYTLSAYFTGQSGATLQVLNGSAVIATSDTVDTMGTVGTDWTRASVRFTVPSGVSSVTVKLNLPSASAGTLYVDSVQLETGETPNRYNMLENADFTDGMTGWTASSNISSATDGITTDGTSSHPTSFSDSVYHITGSCDYTKYIMQTITVNGKKGDTYSFGAWLRSDSIALNRQSYNNRLYGVKRVTIEFINSSGTLVNSVPVYFGADTTDWQYACGSAVASGAYAKIRISLNFHYTRNDCYYDGAQLFREEFSQAYSYDTKGNLTGYKSLIGQQTSFEYDSDDNIKKATDPLGNTTSYTYDGKHNLLTSTSPEGVVTTNTYDTNGNVTQTQVGNAADYIRSQTAYDTASALATAVTDARGNSVEYEYNGATRQQTVITDAKGNQSAYSYGNAASMLRLASLTSDGVGTVNYAYDAYGKLTTISRGDTDYSFTYDAWGRMLDTGVGNVTLSTNTYDAYGRLINVTYGNGFKTIYTYDSLDRVSKISQRTAANAAELLVYEFVYDGEGHLCELRNYKTHRATFFEYDHAGRCMASRKKSFTVSSGNISYTGTVAGYEYEYDVNNNLTKLSQTVAGRTWSVTYTYDKDNRAKTAALDNGVVITNNYDAIGRLSARTVKLGATSTYTTTLTYVSGANDSNTALISAYQNGSDAKYNYAYDANGNITQIWRGSSTFASAAEKYSYVYDAANQLTRENLYYGLGNANNATYTYEYDDWGNLLYRTAYPYTTGAIEAFSGIYTLAYDGNLSNSIYIGKLSNMPTSVLMLGGVSTTVSTQQPTCVQNTFYGWNTQPDGSGTAYAAGDPITLNANITLYAQWTDTRGINPAGDEQPDNRSGEQPTQIYVYEYGNASWGDQLTVIKGYSISSTGVAALTDTQNLSYDAMGNPTSYDGINLTWEGKQLTGSSKSGQNISYAYDENGLRTQKTVNGVTTNYYYNGSILMGMVKGSGSSAIQQLFSYDANGNVVSVDYSSNGGSTFTTYYYLRNAQNDVVKLIDGSGNTVVEYRYDSWGKLVGTTGSLAGTLGLNNPFRYRGYVYDTETGFYATGTRYYDPVVGRFINADGYVATGQGVLGNNMFAYCANNPVMYADPSGKFFISALIAVVAVATVALVAGGCSAKPEPKPEPYKSPDEAARAFSESTYSSSRYIRHEYSTEIYSRTINGETTYNYNTPRSGTPHSASVGAATPSGTKTVAYAHTHPNSNSFSSTDKKAAASLNIDAYVVGPNLELQRYDLATTNTINLGVISPIALTDSQKGALVSEFQVSWDNHVAAGCDFNCGSMTWPTP